MKNRIKAGTMALLAVLLLWGCGKTPIRETAVTAETTFATVPPVTEAETEPPVTEIRLGGEIVDVKTTELSFVEAEVTAAQLREAFEQLHDLQMVEVRDCGISQEDMIGLVQDYPAVEFLWDVDFFGQRLPSDTEEIDISKTPVADVAEVERLAACFPHLKKVVMAGCGVDDETMDALNRRHEDVQYVWEVKVCWRMLRTDITWFFPFKLDVEPVGDDLYNLRYCTEVVCVDLGHALVKDIEWARYMPKLKYMLFGDTQISDISPLEDHKELIYLEMFKTQVSDYAPLLSCTALEDLNLSYTYGDAEIIRQMTWLKHLWWHRPTPPWGGPETETRLHLADYLPDAVVDVRYTSGSTDGGWREIPNYFAQRDYLGMFYMEG